MEQYWNSMWKNYTASISRNSDGTEFSADTNDVSDTFANNDLHYKIPFWIGVIVISLLFLSAIIASIRYCFYMICSAAHRETEKVSLVPPRSPFLRTNVLQSHTLPRQQRPSNNGFINDSSIDEKFSSSSPSEKFERQPVAHMSIVPIVHPQLRPVSNTIHTLPRRQQMNMDFEDSYFPPMETPRIHISNEFRKKVQGVYVLPVSPALSSSSSTTNTDETSKHGSNTMPIRSLRHISSSNNIQNDSSTHGIKNDCFTDSPLPKDRTLPRSQANTLRRVQAPSQPPPLPPVATHIQSNVLRSFVDPQTNQMVMERRLTKSDLDPNEISLTFTNQVIYDMHREQTIKKAPPPPVPSRSQKPSVVPIGFESLTTNPPGRIGFQSMIESAVHDDFSEHWPKPPDSMITSEKTGAPPILPPSIPYDRLNHEHLMSTILIRQNSKSNFFQHHRFDEHHMFSESET